MSSVKQTLMRSAKNENHAPLLTDILGKYSYFP